MKTDKLMLLGAVVLAGAGISYGSVQAYGAHEKVVAAQHQHDLMHRQNEDRHRREAYAEHLKRAAYDRAHPEVVAARKAAAREKEQSQEAAQRERAHQREVARQAQARKDAEAQRIAQADEAARTARQEKESHPCDTADRLEREAAGADGQRQYDLSVSGLHYVELCDNETDNVINKGYLLSFKAFAERHLSSGDSVTDLNQATTLLAECQTLPGVYGTHAGAQCETQEENDIRVKTSWDMARYEAENN